MAVSSRHPPSVSLLRAIKGLATDPLSFFLDARQRHGDIYRLGLGRTGVVLLNHPRHVRHVFREHYKNYGKGGALWDALRDYLGNGLLVTEGEVWLRQRRLLQPLFHRNKLIGRVPSMASTIAQVLDSWETEIASNRILDLSPACARLSMGVSSGAMFGSMMSHQESQRLVDDVRVVIDYMVWSMLMRRLPERLSPGRARYRNAMERIHATLDRLIDQYRHTGEEGDGLMAMFSYLEDTGTGARMSRELMRDETLDLLLGAYETTAQSLVWIFYFITRYPEIAARLRTEVDDVLGNRMPGADDLEHLSYVRRVICEALRYYPPGAWNTRMAREDDVIDGFHIAQGTTVVVVTYAVHHHPEIWSEPERFNPDRFLPEVMAQQDRFAWVPFGTGPRVCMGMEFALIELVLAVAMVLQRYDLRPVSPTAIVPRLRTTLSPGQPVLVQLQPRVSAQTAMRSQA